MSISDWFTVFSLLLAVYALYSSEERTIIALKLWKYDPQLLLITIFVILLLTKYDDILTHFPILQNIKVSWGLHSSNWALIIFLVLLIYFGFKLYNIPSKLPSEDLIEFYRKFLKRDFNSFFILFNKYERNSSNEKYFLNYKSIIFDPVFIESNTNEPYYSIHFLDVIDDATFKIYFSNLINNNNSIFYKELRSNNNSYLVNEDNYFLYELLHKKPALFIQIGGLKIIKDWYLLHLQNEKIKGAQSIYNQQTEQLINNIEIQFPLYLHILFVKLLYNEAIVQKVDIDSVVNRYRNMQSIFSNIIEKCIEGINRNSYQLTSFNEYPTYYHFIIAKIFDVIERWLTSFNEDENFVSNSSYISFFPTCLNNCIDELLKGFRKSLISEAFLISIIHYHMFVLYKRSLKDPIREEIENECILELPLEIIEPVLTYSLNEEFALSYDNFKQGIFDHPGSNEDEMFIIERLYQILKKKELL